MHWFSWGFPTLRTRKEASGNQKAEAGIFAPVLYVSKENECLSSWAQVFLMMVFLKAIHDYRSDVLQLIGLQ